MCQLLELCHSSLLLSPQQRKLHMQLQHIRLHKNIIRYLLLMELTVALEFLSYFDMDKYRDVSNKSSFVFMWLIFITKHLIDEKRMKGLYFTTCHSHLYQMDLVAQLQPTQAHKNPNVMKNIIAAHANLFLISLDNAKGRVYTLKRNFLFLHNLHVYMCWVLVNQLYLFISFLNGTL